MFALLHLRWSWTVVVVGCLTVTGCCTPMNWRGDGFKPDPSMEMGNLRPPERQGDFFGFSNKSRQIEKNVGI